MIALMFFMLCIGSMCQAWAIKKTEPKSNRYYYAQLTPASQKNAIEWYKELLLMYSGVTYENEYIQDILQFNTQYIFNRNGGYVETLSQKS